MTKILESLCTMYICTVYNVHMFYGMYYGSQDVLCTYVHMYYGMYYGSQDVLCTMYICTMVCTMVAKMGGGREGRCWPWPVVDKKTGFCHGLG